MVEFAPSRFILPIAIPKLPVARFPVGSKRLWWKKWLYEVRIIHCLFVLTILIFSGKGLQGGGADHCLTITMVFEPKFRIGQFLKFYHYSTVFIHSKIFAQICFSYIRVEEHCLILVNNFQTLEFLIPICE